MGYLKQVNTVEYSRNNNVSNNDFFFYCVEMPVISLKIVKIKFVIAIMDSEEISLYFDGLTLINKSCKKNTVNLCI